VRVDLILLIYEYCNFMEILACVSCSAVPVSCEKCLCSHTGHLCSGVNCSTVAFFLLSLYRLVVFGFWDCIMMMFKVQRLDNLALHEMQLEHDWCNLKGSR
jgi:hypothetical protein